MKVIAESSLTTKEQLTLPVTIRRLLGVKSGDTVVWGLDERGQVIVEAGRPHSLADVRSALSAAGAPTRGAGRVTVARMKAGIAAALRDKHAGR